METTDSPTESTAPKISRAWALAAFCVLLLVLLAALELAARVLVSAGDNPTLQRVVADYRRLAVEGPEWIRFVPDAELGYRLRPDFELGATRHHGDGFRGDSEFTPKPPDTLRIACLGASTTYGVSVDDNDETYPARLEALLNGTMKPAGWDRVEVYNLGVGGYTSREILGTLKRTLPILQPDVVLIQNAINDVIPRFYPDYRPDYSHFRTRFTPLEVSALDRIAYRSQAWLAIAFGTGRLRPLSLQSQTQHAMPPVDEALANLAKNPPTGFVANLTGAVSTAQAQGCQVWLLTQPYLDVPEFAGPNEASRRLEGGYRRGLAEHTAAVIALAEDYGVGLIRLHDDMPRQKGYFSDPIHMTAAGNRRKAELIATAIAPKLPAPDS